MQGVGGGKKWRYGGLLVLDGGNEQEKEEGSSGQRRPWEAPLVCLWSRARELLSLVRSVRRR